MDDVVSRKQLDRANEASVAIAEAATARIRELTDQLEALRTALKPFAAAYEDQGDGAKHEDRHNLWEHPAALDLTVGDLRKALAALRLAGATLSNTTGEGSHGE